MYLSPINYRPNVKQNRFVTFNASPETIKRAANAATVAVKTTAEQLTSKSGAAAIGAATMLSSLGILKYQESDLSPWEHSQRASNAMQKLKDSGFSNPNSELYHYQFNDLSYITGNCFDSIIDDFIQIHKGVEEGQPIKEYVNSKLQEIITKYDLPE